MDKDNKDPQIEERAPESGVSGQAEKKIESNTEAPLNLPDKFKDKSPQEIAEMYVNLEKKLGETSTEVEEARKLKEQTDVLLRSIYSDPDVYRSVESAVERYQSGDTLPDNRKKGDNSNKGDEEDTTEGNSDVVEIKMAEQNRILNEFYLKNGYNDLEGKERQDKLAKLAVTLAELADPGGKKPIKQILSEIPLTKLPFFLENANYLSNKEEILKGEREAGLASNIENQSASIGSFSATGGKPNSGVTLTSREREIARKMGIPEEVYAKRKQQIIAESKQFE